MQVQLGFDGRPMAPTREDHDLIMNNNNSSDSNAVMHIISKNVRNRVVGHGAVIVMGIRGMVDYVDVYVCMCAFALIFELLFE